MRCTSGAKERDLGRERFRRHLPRVIDGTAGMSPSEMMEKGMIEFGG